jgi:hypothetical protein
MPAGQPHLRLRAAAGDQGRHPQAHLGVETELTENPRARSASLASSPRSGGVPMKELVTRRGLVPLPAFFPDRDLRRAPGGGLRRRRTRGCYPAVAS